MSILKSTGLILEVGRDFDLKQSKALIPQSEYVGVIAAISNSTAVFQVINKKGLSAKQATGVLDETDILINISLPPPTHMSLPCKKVVTLSFPCCFPHIQLSLFISVSILLPLSSIVFLYCNFLSGFSPSVPITHQVDKQIL